MDLKGIFSGVSEKVTGAIDSVKTTIAESKSTETSTTSKLPSIKGAVDKVKGTITAAVEIHEIRDLDLNGWKTNSLFFFCDTKNPVTILMAPGTMYNSELQMIIDSSEKKAIGMPNEFMCYSFSRLKAIYSATHLNTLNKYFEFAEQDTNDTFNIEDNLLYIIAELYPAKFKLDGDYFKLTEKGKLVLVPLIEDEDYIVSDVDIVYECVPETEAETTTETASETEAETTTKTVSETEAETTTETVSETEAETTTETVNETEAETTTETVNETEAETTTETVNETEAETTTEIVSETEAETTTETVSQPKAEATTETQNTPKASSKPRRKKTSPPPKSSAKKDSNE